MGSEQAVRDGLLLLTASLRQEVDVIQRRAYVRGLSKVPSDVVLAGADRLIDQLATESRGKRYFPSVPDWLAACAEIINDRRALAARQARALAEDCPTCGGSGWETVMLDVERLRRCTCFMRGLELMAAAGEPLALPPAREIEDGAA